MIDKTIDGTDFFIINACIKNEPYEAIARTLHMDEGTFKARIEALRAKGFNVYPGMPGSKLTSRESDIYNLLLQGKSRKEIMDICGLARNDTITRAKEKIEKIKSGNGKKSEETPKETRKEVNLSPEIQEQIIKWKNQGLSLTRMAKNLGMHPNSFESLISGLIKSGNADPRIAKSWIEEETWVRRRKPVEEPTEEDKVDNSEDFEI